MECKKTQNKSFCPCTFSCAHKGVCCECVQYHVRLGEFPACFFSAKAEKTGDRSLSMLVADRNKT